MFGFIKNLIGGIFGFIGGLFGKKDEFYLELKEEGGSTPSVAPAPEPAQATASKPEPAQATASKPEPAQATTSKPKAAKASKTESVKTPTPQKEPVKTEPAVTNFATEYLLSISSGRRRPGANMNSFLDMARQVKVPG